MSLCVVRPAPIGFVIRQKNLVNFLHDSASDWLEAGRIFQRFQCRPNKTDAHFDVFTVRPVCFAVCRWCN
jgi:hypothetical protein